MHDFALMLLWIKTKLKTYWCTKMLALNSAQTVAAAVPRSPEFVCALDRIAAVKAKEVALHGEVAALSKKRGSALKTSDVAAINIRLEAIGTELRTVETERKAALQDVEHHRPTYAAEVRTALSQQRRDAAARVVAAITVLQKATAELDETAAAIRAAGGHARHLPCFPLIDGLQKIAKTIEAEA